MLRRKLMLLFCWVLIPVQTLSQTIALRAGRLINPENGKADANQIILIEKGKITAIGGGLKIPPGATTIDLSRFTVLPGLFAGWNRIPRIDYSRNARSLG